MTDRCVCTKTSYAIEVEASRFNRLIDWLSQNSRLREMENELEKAVPNVHSIACELDFGNYVHFDLNKNDDTKENRDKIVGIIDIYLENSNEYDTKLKV